MARRLQDFRAQLGLIALGGLAIRVTAVAMWTRHLEPQGDQNFYWRQGQDLAQGFGFVYRNNVGERVATAVHPPLYSAYLGVVGLFRFPESSHAPYRMATTLLGFAAVIVIGLAGRKIAGNRVGLMAAVLAAVYPNLWINDAMMLSEAMYTLTIGLVLLTAYRFHKHPSALTAAALGFTIALATLTRAEALILFMLILVPLSWILRNESWRFRLSRMAIGGAAGLLLLAPWVARNFATFERHPITISNGTGFVLEQANCDQTYGLAPPMDASGNPQPDATADKFLGYWNRDCDRTPWPVGDETMTEAAKRETALDYMSNHKRQVPIVVAARVGRMWEVWRPGQSYEFNKFFENRGDRTTIAAMAMYYPLLVFSAYGFIVLWKRRTTVVPFIAVLAMTTLTAALSFGITRYRVGADVALTILAAVAIDKLLSKIVTDKSVPQGTIH